MNKILIGLLAISVGANVFLLTKPKDVVVKQSEPEKVIVKETETVVRDDIELKAKLKKVEAELAQTKQALAKLKDKQELEKERLELPDEERVSEVSFVTKDMNIADKIAKDRENVQDIYKKEPVNPEWAYAMQDKVAQVLSEKGDASLYHVEGASCKTSVCKLSLKPYTASGGSKLDVAMNATMSISEEDSLRDYQMLFELSPNKESIELYMTKPEPKGK